MKKTFKKKKRKLSVSVFSLLENVDWDGFGGLGVHDFCSAVPSIHFSLIPIHFIFWPFTNYFCFGFLWQCVTMPAKFNLSTSYVWHWIYWIIGSHPFPFLSKQPQDQGITILVDQVIRVCNPPIQTRTPAYSNQVEGYQTNYDDTRINAFDSEIINGPYHNLVCVIRSPYFSFLKNKFLN